MTKTTFTTYTTGTYTYTREELLADARPQVLPHPLAVLHPQRFIETAHGHVDAETAFARWLESERKR